MFVVVCRLIQELEGLDHDDYIHSICTDETLKKLSSGKVGTVFHISNDNRFLIKILRKSEIKVLNIILRMNVLFVVFVPYRLFNFIEINLACR